MNGYFFDMDGTLYNNRFHEVSEKTFKMLNELQSQGHFVALSTSRCQSELKNLPSCMRSFQFDCMISDGGALILDKQKEVLEMNCIPKETMRSIDHFVKNETWNIVTVHEGEIILVRHILVLRIIYILSCI